MSNEAREAKAELVEKWGDVMSDLTQQMIEQAAATGMKPEWFYPKKIVETSGPNPTIRIHWGLRPDVEAALQALDAGGSAEEAAKIGAAFSSRSLEDLIMNDTLWEHENEL